MLVPLFGLQFPGDTTPSSAPPLGRSFRAAAMLVPLFGLQFLVTALPPPDDVDCDVEQVYYVVSYLISGLQGALVACIYFYTNAEVRSLLTYKKVRAEVIVHVRNAEAKSSRIYHHPNQEGRADIDKLTEIREQCCINSFKLYFPFPMSSRSQYYKEKRQTIGSFYSIF